MGRYWVALSRSNPQFAPSHPTPRHNMATSATMMQYQSKLECATGRALMPDRGGEYREAFRHGGWHSSSRIACHSSQRDLCILTRQDFALVELRTRLIDPANHSLCRCHFSSPDVHQPPRPSLTFDTEPQHPTLTTQSTPKQSFPDGMGQVTLQRWPESRDH